MSDDAMDENKVSSISKSDNYQDMGAFWDDHDFTDFDDPEQPDVQFEIHDTVRLESELLAALGRIAASRGVTVETLVNLWLQEKVLQQTAA
jgi:hypothetical protein